MAVLPGREWAMASPSTLVLGLAFDDPVRQNLYAAAWAGAFGFDPVAATWKSIVTQKAPRLPSASRLVASGP
jgi:hypothetical protein